MTSGNKIMPGIFSLSVPSGLYSGANILLIFYPLADIGKLRPAGQTRPVGSFNFIAYAGIN